MPPASDGNVPSRRRIGVTSQTPYQKAGATNEPNANQLSHTPHTTFQSGLNLHLIYRCRYINLQCNFQTTKKASFKRHITDVHYPQYDFLCHFDDCLSHFNRADKLKSHYLLVHQTHLSQGEIDNCKISLPVPVSCPVCPRIVRDWPDFYRCFMNHCEAIESDEEAREDDEGQFAEWSRRTT